MIGTVEWLAGAVAIAGALWRVLLWRGSPLQPGTRHLLAFTVTIGLSMVLLPFSQPHGAGTGGGTGSGHCPVPEHLLPLICFELKLAAEGFLVLLALTVGPGERSRSRIRRQATATALVMAATAALYVVAGVRPTDVSLTVEKSGRAALAAFDTLFVAHSLWCVGLFTLVVHRSARQLGPGLLRTGLRVIVAAGVSGLVWSGLGITVLVSGLRTGRQDSGVNGPSATLALTTLALTICGMTISAWGDRMAAPVRRLRARRDHRRIGPLWSALYAVHPEIALEPPGGRSRRGPSADPEFALYRRVIEIRDGQLALRAHLHPEVPEWAAEGCRTARLDLRRSTATVEAAVLAAALEAAAAGRRYPYPATHGHTPPATPPDLHTETARLALVAEAFTRSPVVAAVRHRVRRELAAGADR